MYKVRTGRETKEKQKEWLSQYKDSITVVPVVPVPPPGPRRRWRDWWHLGPDVERDTRHDLYQCKLSGSSKVQNSLFSYQSNRNIYIYGTINFYVQDIYLRSISKLILVVLKGNVSSLLSNKTFDTFEFTFCWCVTTNVEYKGSYLNYSSFYRLGEGV